MPLVLIRISKGIFDIGIGRYLIIQFLDMEIARFWNLILEFVLEASVSPDSCFHQNSDDRETTRPSCHDSNEAGFLQMLESSMR